MLGLKKWLCSKRGCGKDPAAATACVHRKRPFYYLNDTIGRFIGIFGIEEPGGGGEDHELADVGKLFYFIISLSNSTSPSIFSSFSFPLVFFISCICANNFPSNLDELAQLRKDLVVAQHTLRLNLAHTSPSLPRSSALSQPTISPAILLFFPLSCLKSSLLVTTPDVVAASKAQMLLLWRACRIYGTHGITKRSIQVQSCIGNGCRHRRDGWTVGPDLGEYALFNWNNEIILSHELLNAYPSQLVTSPTPLTAF